MPTSPTGRARARALAPVLALVLTAGLLAVLAPPAAAAAPTNTAAPETRWSWDVHHRIAARVTGHRQGYAPKRATPSWNAAGGSLRGYRNMVVNHEVGHWLGRGHAGCPGRGRLAPVMMQQSKDLRGCRFNAFPTRGEL